MTEETNETGTAEKSRTDENVIYVGHKPPMSYVLAVVTQLYSGRYSRNCEKQVYYRCETKRDKNWHGEPYQCGRENL